MRPSIKITLIYSLFGVLWILLSDYVLLFFVEIEIDPSYSSIQSIKGIFYVLTTAILLYLLIDNYYRSLNSKLKELERVNNDLKNHQKQLENSNMELEQFAYVISHDLQEPLRMISMFVSKIKEKYSQHLDEKAHQYIGFAMDGAKKMRQIILDLLAYSQLDLSEKNIYPVNLNEIIDEVKVLLSRKIEESSATIEYGDFPKVIIHKSPLRMILQKLVGNALKYHKTHEPPKIFIAVLEKDSLWEFTIKDNGIGISDEHKENIFNLFNRLPHKTTHEGTGIGLAVCRKIIKNMGGEIWVESVEDMGSTFHFTIPKAQ